MISKKVLKVYFDIDLILRILPIYLAKKLARLNYGNIWTEIPSNATALFIHIPKCAGTSVSHVIYGKEIIHRPAYLYSLIGNTENQEIPSFAIIRNPFERFCSIFFHFKHATRASSNDKAINSKLISKFDSPSELCKHLSQDKSDRITFFKQPVAKPQSYWIVYKKKLMVDKLLLMSDMPKVQEYLSKIGKKDVELPLKNKSNDVLYEPLMTPELVAFVNKWYEEDVLLWEKLRK